jgi:NADPH2:quinone reductase
VSLEIINEQGLRATSIRVATKSADADHLALDLAELRLEPGPVDAVVEIRAAGVNPSDGKAMLGVMPQAVWPRTPGRDFAGQVVDGPAELVGREVWGSSGELGIKRDGSHATHLVVPAASLREKPRNLSFKEAGSIGVPFVTAQQGFAEGGGIKPTDVVLVLGCNGKVGQAAVQLATQAGARVFAVARGERYIGYASGPVTYIAATDDVAATVRDATGGQGANLVYNTVGSPYFEAGSKSLAKLGRQLFISTFDRAVPFDIFAFYRGRHRFIGVDSLALSTAECGDILDTLKPGFEAGTLRAFPFAEQSEYSLAGARDAYRAVLGGETGRIVLNPAL